MEPNEIFLMGSYSVCQNASKIIFVDLRETLPYFGYMYTCKSTNQSQFQILDQSFPIAVDENVDLEI